MNLMENLEYKVMCTTFEEGIFLKRQPNSGTAKQLEYLWRNMDIKMELDGGSKLSDISEM